MSEIAGFIIVCMLFAFGSVASIVVALAWLVFGCWCVDNSASRGLLADIGFVFGAPVYWVLER